MRKIVITIILSLLISGCDNNKFNVSTNTDDVKLPPKAFEDNYSHKKLSERELNINIESYLKAKN